MGKLLVLRPMLALSAGMLLAACADDTSVTSAGSLDPEPTTTVSAATTTDPQLETTSTEPPPEETTISASLLASFEGIAGTYETKDPGGEGFLRIMDDGTMQWAPNENGAQIVLDARVEGTRVLITDPDCGEDVEGVYEFHLLETGDLAVVLIEDACSGRASNVPGEYRPVE